MCQLTFSFGGSKFFPLVRATYISSTVSALDGEFLPALGLRGFWSVYRDFDFLVSVRFRISNCTDINFLSIYASVLSDVLFRLDSDLKNMRFFEVL